MPYQPNIPLATDRLSKSQSDLNGNFQELDTYLNVNHTPIDGTGDQGKHKFVTMPAASPDPSALATEATLFSKAGSIDTSPQLYWIQGTTNKIVNFTEYYNGATDGWTFLPSGLLIKWVIDHFNSTTSNVVTSTIPWPNGSGQPAFAINSPFIIQILPKFGIAVNPNFQAAYIPTLLSTNNESQISYRITFTPPGSFAKPPTDTFIFAVGLAA